MLRTVLPTLLLTALIAAGCGGDDGPAAAPADRGAERPANLDLAEAQGLLEAGRPALVRQALDGDAAIAGEVRPRPADSARLAGQNGRELDLLVFPTPEIARRAWSSVLATDALREGDGAAMRAVNLVVVFPRADGDLYDAVRRRLRALSLACDDAPGGENRALRRLCFGGEGGIPPAGEGTDRDELLPIGAEARVGPFRYAVVSARQLNPRVAPDRELAGGVRAGDGRLLFGVFVRACNAGTAIAAPTERLRVVGAFGRRIAPVGLPATNPFSYQPRRVEPGACLPSPGSAATRTAGGAVVLFALPVTLFQGERPLALEIVSSDGAERAAVQLDV